MNLTIKALPTFLIGILLSELAKASPNCFSSEEFAPLALPLYGFRDFREVTTQENLKAQTDFYNEFKLKIGERSISVRHMVGETSQNLYHLKNEQKMLALIKGTSAKHSVPTLTTCVKIDKNFVFFYDSYGPSLRQLFDHGEYMHQRERYSVYSQLAKIFGKLDDYSIIYNRFSLKNIRRIGKSYNHIQITDFSTSYIAYTSCKGAKKQIGEPQAVQISSQQYMCTQMIQVVWTIIIIEHIHYFRDFHKKYVADDQSRIKHYCSEKIKDKKLQEFLCYYVGKKDILNDDIINIRKGIVNLHSSKKKHHHHH